MLTISDEAFLLLVLVNYASRWIEELKVETKKVSKLMAFLLTFSSFAHLVCSQALKMLRPVDEMQMPVLRYMCGLVCY